MSVAQALRERLRNKYDVRPEDLDAEVARVMARAFAPLNSPSKPGPARPTYKSPREPDVPVEELDALREKIQSALAEDNLPDEDA
jgi:hypothetical protein